MQPRATLGHADTTIGTRARSHARRGHAAVPELAPQVDRGLEHSQRASGASVSRTRRRGPGTRLIRVWRLATATRVADAPLPSTGHFWRRPVPGPTPHRLLAEQYAGPLSRGPGVGALCCWPLTRRGRRRSARTLVLVARRLVPHYVRRQRAQVWPEHRRDCV